MVLTAAHFFDHVREEDTRLSLDATGTHRRAMRVETIPGTDLALVVTNARFSAELRPYLSLIHI